MQTYSPSHARDRQTGDEADARGRGGRDVRDHPRGWKSRRFVSEVRGAHAVRPGVRRGEAGEAQSPGAQEGDVRDAGYRILARRAPTREDVRWRRAAIRITQRHAANQAPWSPPVPERCVKVDSTDAAVVAGISKLSEIDDPRNAIATPIRAEPRQ